MRKQLVTSAVLQQQSGLRGSLTEHRKTEERWTKVEQKGTETAEVTREGKRRMTPDTH